MKKSKKEVVVYLRVDVDGEAKNLQFDADVLRNWLDNLKIEPGQETVDFTFTLEGKTYTQPLKITTELQSIKRAVTAVKFVQEDIVPKKLQGYLVDYTQKLCTKNKAAIKGREHEIEKAWFFLSQKERNNVFLVGGKDVGKTTIALELIRQIATGECPKELADKRVIMLRPELLLQIKSDHMYERKIDEILDFLHKNKNKIILYVDKAIYLRYLINILFVCLKKYNIPLITTSSEANFDDYFYQDQSIAKYINFIYVYEPEYEEIEPMIRRHIKKLEKQHGIKISKEMVNFGIYTSSLSDSVSENPGNVINIFERAFLEAKRKDKTEVDKKSILKCFNTLLKEYEKTPEEAKIATAYHETGHYILAVKSEHFKDIKISCVSNLPMNWWAGVTMSYNNLEEYVVHSKDYFLDYIAFLLGGRTAERKFTRLNSVGASNDIERANNIAKAMVMTWGFSENAHNKNRQYDFADYYLMPETQKALINKEIQDIIDEGTRRAEEVINENEELLKIIAEKLLVEEIITGEQLKAICDEYEQSKNNK